jgi:predicted MFS family arabinose efflux permease
MVLVLSFVTGCCWAISGPSYQVIMVDLVEREDLANAIALNSSQFQLARVAGPTLAALTMKAFGMAGCFLANGLSYAAIVAALSRVRFKQSGAAPAAAVGGGKAEAARRSMWDDLAEGFRYVRGRPRVGAILLGSAVVGLFGAPYLVLLPLFARNVYGWRESGLSLLMGTAGAGALVGALGLAYFDVRRKGLVQLSAMLSAGACIVGLASAPTPWMAVPLLFATGMSMVCFFALGNTLLQQLVTDEMRGRVMSMWLLSFIGTMPVGSFLSGAAADRFGPRPTLAACGLVVFACGLAAIVRYPRLREM